MTPSFSELQAQRAERIAAANAKREQRVSAVRDEQNALERDHREELALADVVLSEPVAARKIELRASLPAIDATAAAFVCEDTRALSGRLIEQWRALNADGLEAVGEVAGPHHLAIAFFAAKYPDHESLAGDQKFLENEAVVTAASRLGSSSDPAVARARALELEAAVAAIRPSLHPSPERLQAVRSAFSTRDFILAVESWNVASSARRQQAAIDAGTWERASLNAAIGDVPRAPIGGTNANARSILDRAMGVFS